MFWNRKGISCTRQSIIFLSSVPIHFELINQQLHLKYFVNAIPMTNHTHLFSWIFFTVSAVDNFPILSLTVFKFINCQTNFSLSSLRYTVWWWVTLANIIENHLREERFNEKLSVKYVNRHPRATANGDVLLINKILTVHNRFMVPPHRDALDVAITDSNVRRWYEE